MNKMYIDAYIHIGIKSTHMNKMVHMYHVCKFICGLANVYRNWVCHILHVYVYAYAYAYTYLYTYVSLSKC
jgi:hypothetical protein